MRNAAAKTGETVAARVPGGAPGVPAAGGSVAMPTPVANPFLGRGPGPKPKRYRVLNGGAVMVNNARTTLRAGKEIDTNNYDINGLKKQGIRLEELVDDVEPTTAPATA